MPTRRAFLGWSGVTGYGAWVLLKPSPRSHKPPKPTTTTTVAPTTTTVVAAAGDQYHDAYQGG